MSVSPLGPSTTTQHALEELELRWLLEERAALAALPRLSHSAMAEIRAAADECERFAERAEVAAELQANRRFHLVDPRRR